MQSSRKGRNILRRPRKNERVFPVQGADPHSIRPTFFQAVITYISFLSGIAPSSKFDYSTLFDGQSRVLRNVELILGHHRDGTAVVGCVAATASVGNGGRSSWLSCDRYDVTSSKPMTTRARHQDRGTLENNVGQQIRKLPLRGKMPRPFSSFHGGIQRRAAIRGENEDRLTGCTSAISTS